MRVNRCIYGSPSEPPGGETDGMSTPTTPAIPAPPARPPLPEAERRALDDQALRRYRGFRQSRASRRMQNGLDR